MTQQMVLEVQGTTCTGCERRLAAAMGRLEDVRSALADHTTKTLQVELGPEADEEAVTARVAESGYTITGQKVRS